MCGKMPCRETCVFILLYRSDCEQLGTLIERPFRRGEHLLHQMLPAAGKYKVHVGQELDMGTQQCFDAFLLIFCDLLEFVYGNIAPFLRRAQILEYLFQGVLFLGWSHIYRHLGGTSQFVKSKHGPATAHKPAYTAQRFLRGGIQLSQHCPGKQAHKIT